MLLGGALLGAVSFELSALLGRAPAAALEGAEADAAAFALSGAALALDAITDALVLAVALAGVMLGGGTLRLGLAPACDGTDGASANAGVASRTRRMLFSQ